MVNIRKLILTPSGEYKEVYKKPLTVNATVQNVQALETVVNEKLEIPGNRLNAVDIATVTPDLITVSDTPLGKANIPNGWSTERLRFLMEVVENKNGSEYISYIQGYSEYYDPTFRGNIDDNMKFFINSITNAISTLDPNTGFPVTYIQDTFNVLYDPSLNTYSIDYEPGEMNKVVRPKDLIEGMQSLDTFGEDSSIETIDYRSTYSDKPLTSKRNNLIPTEHLAKSINGFIDGALGSTMGYGETDMLSIASSTLTEPLLLTVPFIHELSMLTGDPKPVAFTLNNLKAIDARVQSPEVTVLVGKGEIIQNLQAVNNTMVTEELFVPTIENKIASTVVGAITSIMVDNFLTTVSFTITNDTPTREIEVGFANVNSFIPNLNLSGYINKFITKFKFSVMQLITQNGQLTVSMVVDADILGDTIITVSVNRGEMVTFRLPTFADSLFSNVITTQDHQQLLVSDFQNVVTSVVSSVY